jgi:hypothetical protein
MNLLTNVLCGAAERAAASFSKDRNTQSSLIAVFAGRGVPSGIYNAKFGAAFGDFSGLNHCGKKIRPENLRHSFRVFARPVFAGAATPAVPAFLYFLTKIIFNSFINGKPLFAGIFALRA